MSVPATSGLLFDRYPDVIEIRVAGFGEALLAYDDRPG